MNIYITGEINEETVKLVYDKIMGEYKTGEEISLVFDTPGGYIESAYQILDMLKELKEAGSTIIAKNTGDVMSAATVLWLLADYRIWDNKAGQFLIHNPYIENASGDANTFIEAATELTRLEDKLKEQYSSISGKSDEYLAALMDKNEPMNLEELERLRFITHKVVNKRKYNKKDSFYGKAMNAAGIKSMLEKGIVEFTFNELKENGASTTRVGTRNTDILETMPGFVPPAGVKEVPPQQTVYWDIEAEDWRSFRNSEFGLVLDFMNKEEYLESL